MSKETKIRVWDKTKLKWFGGLDKRFLLETSAIFPDKFEISLNYSNFIVQEFTGLCDKVKKECYEGDLVKFKYTNGDFPLDTSNYKKNKNNKLFLNKTYIGEVKWQKTIASFEIFCGTDEVMIFPANYITHGKIIGNILENPQLKSKWSLNLLTK
jgi:hypothetical protein